MGVELDAVTARFDDMAALTAAVSDEFGPWGPPIEVTQDMIDRFAELSGDHQWIHVDVDRARRESPFGTAIAHGFLTLALLPQLKPSAVTVTGHSSAINYGATSLRFLSPVPSGASIRARCRLIEARQRANGTLTTTEIEVNVVGVHKPALRYHMQVLYQ